MVVVVKILEKLNKFLKKYANILIINIPFILMFIYIFIISLDVNYYAFNILSPILFGVTWIILFIGISINLKSSFGKVFYLILNIIFGILFMVNCLYYSITNVFFDFNLLELASEGTPYILDTIKNANFFTYLVCISLVVAIIFGIKFFPKREKNNFKGLCFVFIMFFILHFMATLSLGKADSELTWSSWRNARNIYNSFNDTNKSLKVSGFYEYEIRNFYVTFIKKEEPITKEDIEFLNNSFSLEPSIENEYTGIFEGKNLIIIQLEGMDNWLIDAKTTPTLYKMKNEGINFTNHYSFYNGGGSTFNSEFVINTGYITPFSYTRNAYTFNKNNFPYSLANLFKNLNYRVNAFHMNTGEYYSRTPNYKNWGYDNYYGLKDVGNYTDSSYELDRELILNEKFGELMFPEEPFVDYIITYSGHLPFTNTKGVCKMLYELDNELLEKDTSFVEMSEEECVRRQNQETDYMVELLLEKLKEKGLYDNTVIVVVTDHYLYTLTDQSILEKYKDTANNLINKTPFFIWSSDLKHKEIKEVTSQLNILPTILNLYGIDYNVNNYIGKDALQTDYKGLVFFSDYSWYDGKVYVDGGVVTNGKHISKKELENKNNQVLHLTKKNDLVLKNNYFSR